MVSPFSLDVVLGVDGAAFLGTAEWTEASGCRGPGHRFARRVVAKEWREPPRDEVIP